MQHCCKCASHSFLYCNVVQLSHLRDLKVRLHIAVSVVHAAQVVVRACDNALSIAAHSALKLVEDAVILVQVTQLLTSSRQCKQSKYTRYVSASCACKRMLVQQAHLASNTGSSSDSTSTRPPVAVVTVLIVLAVRSGNSSGSTSSR
jgi:hypothetical protein